MLKKSSLTFSQKKIDELFDLYNCGKYEKVLIKAKIFIQKHSNVALVHNVLGGANFNLGNLQEAINNYKTAIDIKPNFAGAYSNLGIVYRNLDKIKEAVVNHNKAISIRPDIKIFWKNFSNALTNLSFHSYNEEIADSLLKILNQKTIVRPKIFVETFLSLIKQHPTLKEIFNKLNLNDINIKLEKICIDLIKIPIFLKFIEISTIPDLKIEWLLINLRRNLLLNKRKILNEKAILKFQNSLALHCFTNEFVFVEAKEETLAIEKLENDIEYLILKKKNINLYMIACLASYRPLHRYKWSHNLKVSKELKNLFNTHVIEVIKENLIRNDIKSLKNIEDKTSVTVKKQYERNPYPRWINTEINFNPVSFSVLAKQLKLKFIDNDNFPNNPEILIAGCGTGEHAIGAANRYLNCKVLAVDLSLSSLSYAIRKTKELNIKNIDYLQADILDLKLLNKNFDIIESAGVLHHMKNPLDGWKILSDCLKQNGFMRIALYSELARSSIVQFRKIISDSQLINTKKEILNFRQDIIKDKFPNLSKIKTLSDFYSTSELKDLLFHVQEHRFTIPKIKLSLEKLDLKFSGFELFNQDIKNKFKEQFSDLEAIYSLDAWHKFEKMYPDTFTNMYQFWVKKT